ncbi:polyamine aminopropyltransferase [Coralliovum pocilloporae]|uniref:polyamine aminopropyltransferase n=1 Tax=Coralliovum pocilloporae TaxID=3066369 RepID=UPI003307B930
MTDKAWFSETLHDGIRFSFEADTVLYEQKTEHQHLALIENQIFGKVLMLDGVTQVTSADEFIYHEMMSHVPILAHGAAKNVLIVGGGDCGLAEEVLKHKSVDKLVQVEIDPAVVDFSKEHFADFNETVFDDSRFELVIDDGMKFVAETDRRFDVVIVDSTDPIGPGGILFTKEFYAAVRNCLTPGGVLVTQNGVPFLQKDELEQSCRFFAELYNDSSAYVICVPTYIGGHMSLGWATDNAALRKTDVATIAERFDVADIETRYYTPDVHVAAFALPKYILDAVDAGIASAQR